MKLFTQIFSLCLPSFSLFWSSATRAIAASPVVNVAASPSAPTSSTTPSCSSSTNQPPTSTPPAPSWSSKSYSESLRAETSSSCPFTNLATESLLDHLIFLSHGNTVFSEEAVARGIDDEAEEGDICGKVGVWDEGFHDPHIGDGSDNALAKGSKEEVLRWWWCGWCQRKKGDRRPVREARRREKKEKKSHIFYFIWCKKFHHILINFDRLIF